MNLSMRLYKKLPSGVWYVEFERGKRRSLKTKDKSEAAALFREVKRQYLAGRLSELRGESTTTLGDFADDYKKWALDARELKTYKADMLAVSMLLDVAPRTLRLDKLTMRHADLMIAAAKKRGCKAGTINAYIRHIRTVFSKVKDWGMLPANPLAGLKEVPKDKTPPVYMQADEVLRFLSSVPDVDERRILTAYIYSGRRRTELLRLRWEDVSLERGEYFVRKSKAHLAKWYPLHPMFSAVLESIGKSDGRVFSRWSHPDSITHLARVAFVSFGRPEMTLHKLRHTFATMLVSEGVDLSAIGSLLGHTDKRATEIYSHVTDDRQREAIFKVRGGPVDLG